MNTRTTAVNEKFVERWKGEEVRWCRSEMDRPLDGETGPFLTSVRVLNSFMTFLGFLLHSRRISGYKSS